MATTKSLDLFAQVKEGYAQALKNAGVPVRFTAKDVETARKYVADNAANAHDGYGFVPAGDYGDLLAVATYRISSIADKADKALHDIAVMLAVTDAHEVWKHVTSLNGKPYKTFASFARDALPNLGESAVRNYVAVARDVYLPIQDGKYKEVEFLKDVPVGTLSLVKSGIGDEIRPAFAEQLQKVRTRKLAEAVKRWNSTKPEERGQMPVIDDVKLSARDLQAALKAAKEAVSAPTKKVEPSPKADPEQIKADLEGAGDKPVNQAPVEDANAALVKRVKALFEGDDAVIGAIVNDVEFHITADADAKRSIIDTLAKCSVNGPAAMEFCHAMLKLFNK